MKEKSKGLLHKMMTCIIILGPGFYFGTLGKPKEMGIAIVGGSIAMAFVNIDKIQKFKGAGFEAEMKLVIDEANATLKELQEIATTTTEATLYQLTESQFFGNFSFSKKLKIHDQLIEKLKAINIKNGQIKKIEKVWNKGILARYHNRVTEEAQGLFKTSQEKNEIAEKLKDLINFKELEIENSRSHRKVLQDNNAINDTINVLLDEFQEFENTFKLKKDGQLFEFLTN